MLKKLASETAIYGLSSIVGRLVNYILVPIHTKIFETSIYGIVSIMYSWAAVLNVVFSYGMETTFFRFASKKEVDSQKVFNQILTNLIISTVVFGSALYFAAPSIATYLGFEGAERFVRWFAMLISIDALVAIPFAKLRLEKRPVKFATIKLINIFLNVGLNYFLLIICKDIHQGEYLLSLQPLINSFYDPSAGLDYVFISNLIANALLIPLLIKEFLQFRPYFSVSYLKPLIKYAYPLLFSGLAFSINEIFDRILLEKWLPIGFYDGIDNHGAVGIYSACYKLSMFISLAVQAYKFAAEPFFFEHGQNRNEPSVFIKSMKYFVVATSIMFLLISLNVDLIAPIFIKKDDFLVGLGVVPFLLMANLFLGVYFNLSVWYKLTDLTKFGGIISGIGALITVIFNFLLIPYLGYYGSAIATLICYGSMMVISYFLGQKHYPIPYKTKSALFYITFASSIVILAFWINIEDTILRFFVNNSLFLLFLGVFYVRERKELLATFLNKK